MNKRLLPLFLIIFFAKTVSAQNQVGVFELEVNDSTKTYIKIFEYLDENGYPEYYSLVKDSNFVEFYSITPDEEDYNLINPVEEGAVIDVNLQFTQADTTFINRIQDYDSPYFIQPYSSAYAAFRYLKNEEYIYGSIFIHCNNYLACVNGVPEAPCFEYRHYPILDIPYSELGSEGRIVAGEGVRSGVITSVKSSKTFSTDEVSVYPNPTSSMLKVESSNGLNYNLYNVTGQFVKEIPANSLEDISDLKNGVYFLKSWESSEVVKIIKN